MREIQRLDKVLKAIVLAGDVILLCIVFLVFYSLFDYRFLGYGSGDSPLREIVLMSLSYLVCNIQRGVILHRRVVRPEQIVVRALRNVMFFFVLSVSVLAFCHFEGFPSPLFLLFYIVFAILLIGYRLFFRYLLKKYRRQGGNVRKVVLVGSHGNMQDLYHSMTDDLTSGYRVIGYFDESPSADYPDGVRYLGRTGDVTSYLECNNIDQLYCSQTAVQDRDMLHIISYCENHLVRFYGIPHVKDYLKRRMYFEIMGNVPLLCIRREPLSQKENQILKRAFDIVFSLLFLCTLFPLIYLIVGLAIKISSPGPVFFKQKRSGEDGREFWCYKFRSMRVNSQSDILQATANDPRKTKLGDFLRKSSIDELPQFINVLKGDMSVVGPRPHMLKHTREYSEVINKFMVRHFVKPGITGWAQVRGYRGETKELWQMEGRVELDIWYIEHWTFWLDVYIIYKTVRNAVRGEKEAY